MIIFTTCNTSLLPVYCLIFHPNFRKKFNFLYFQMYPVLIRRSRRRQEWAQFLRSPWGSLRTWTPWLCLAAWRWPWSSICTMPSHSPGTSFWGRFLWLDSQEPPGHWWPTWSREEDSLSLEVDLLGDHGVRGLLSEGVWAGVQLLQASPGLWIKCRISRRWIDSSIISPSHTWSRSTMWWWPRWWIGWSPWLSANGVHYAIKLDWTIDPVMARKVVGDKVALQGNFDPSALYSSVED